jgi:putative hemolysin
VDADTLTAFLLVLLFVLVGGVFAGTEMAIVSLRQGQVRQIAATGPRGERTAALVNNPNTFLSAVQIGVTVAGFFSSAYGGATIAPDLAPVLVGWGVPEGVAETLALVLMTLLIAYLSLVLGELVPKRLAMQRAVGFTRVLAPPLNAFARVVRPVIWLLSRSTNLVVRLLGGDPHATTEDMSPEELRDVVSTHEGLRPYSRRILTDVFRAGERRVSSVMRPRPDVEFVPGDVTVADAARTVAGSAHSRYPVTGSSSDDVLGFVHIRDLMATPDDEQRRPVSGIVRPILALPGTNHVLQTLATMRREQQHIALVLDEYGGTAGIVTMEDLVEELVGEIYDEYDSVIDPEDAILRQGGSTTLDASLNLVEFAELTGLELDEERYDTVAGFVVDRLGRLAVEGDRVEEEGVVVEVVTVVGHRISRVRVTRLPGGRDRRTDRRAD